MTLTSPYTDWKNNPFLRRKQALDIAELEIEKGSITG